MCSGWNPAQGLTPALRKKEAGAALAQPTFKTGVFLVCPAKAPRAQEAVSIRPAEPL